MTYPEACPGRLGHPFPPAPHIYRCQNPAARFVNKLKGFRATAAFPKTRRRLSRILGAAAAKIELKFLLK
jgi:hypothetical protein